MGFVGQTAFELLQCSPALVADKMDEITDINVVVLIEKMDVIRVNTEYALMMVQNVSRA